MQKHHNGFFITIEGIEGVGKSTAVKFIESYLLKNNVPCLITREPGGTAIAEQIRNVLLTPHPSENMLPETELLLMFATRVQHLENVILPALSAGKYVVSDRFNDASFAYQGGGRGINLGYIQSLDDWLVKRRPDLTILLDISPEAGLQRAKNRGPKDRIEQETTSFFDRVREVYLKRAAEDKKRFRIIDAAQSIKEVQHDIKAILEEVL